MTPDWLTALQQFGRTRSVSAMDILLRQGEPQRSVFWLQDGTGRPGRCITRHRVTKE